MTEILCFDSPDFLPRKEVLRLLDVSETKLDQMVKDGTLHPIKQGRNWVRFARKEVVDYQRGVLRDSGVPFGT